MGKKRVASMRIGGVMVDEVEYRYSNWNSGRPTRVWEIRGGNIAVSFDRRPTSRDIAQAVTDSAVAFSK